MLSSFPTNALGSGITYARLKVQAFMCKGERDGSRNVFIGFFWRINENIKICSNISKNCTMHAADSLRVLSKPSTSQLDNDILWFFLNHMGPQQIAKFHPSLVQSNVGGPVAFNGETQCEKSFPASPCLCSTQTASAKPDKSQSSIFDLRIRARNIFFPMT